MPENKTEIPQLLETAVMRSAFYLLQLLIIN